MAKHYEYYIEKDGEYSETDKEMMEYVHCGNFFGQGDSMLCGHVFEGECEAHWTKSALINARETSKKINCPDCIRIIESCKRVKAIEINRKK